ncbi:DUF2799 domain-containing protein, partial [Acinetobacter baumannii]|nr:DUF2799 domain-containing protein [Acinetobacter baumannii]EKX5020417.1 DUF2799 domain-containing protein [Acinetobacter baumannii]
MKNIGLAILAISLSGCAAMSVEECKTANWSLVGEKDGSKGSSPRLDQYYKACGKANIVPDQKSYERGYKEGLGYYCQPANIFYNALEGNGNINVCPVEQRNRLRPYYRAASDYYNAKAEYDRYDEKFKQYSDSAYNEKLKPEERERYRKLLRELQIDRDRINRNYW